MKVSVESKEVQQLLKEYRPYLSRKDLGKVVELSLRKPEKDLHAVTEEYLEKKFAIDKISDLLESSEKGELSFATIMRKLGISKSKFYRKLNFLKRHYVKRNVDLVVERGKLRRRKSPKRQIKKLLGLKRGKRYILLNPGPVLTTATVKDALVQYDLCHRDPDFCSLIARMKQNALKLFKADETYRCLFISGSGTASMEAMLSSLVPRKGKALVVSNGAFGERLKEILDLHGIPTVHHRWEWGEQIDLETVEKSLKQEEGVTTVVMNHHETSVGLINPVTAMGRLAKKHKKLFLVDAISSLGAEDLNMVRDNIDACCTSSNKCLHGITGLSIICVKHGLIKAAGKQKPRSYYLDLYRHYTYIEEKNQTPYTPNVTAFFALDQAITELLQEGMENRRRKYVRLNALLKSELLRLGFTFFTDYGNESHTILTPAVPEGIEFDEFYQRVKDAGFLIYACKPPLAGKYFQIANMGDINEAMIYDFIFTVEKTLKEIRRKR